MKYYYYIIKDGRVHQVSWSKYYYEYRYKGEEVRQNNRIYIILYDEEEKRQTTSEKLTSAGRNPRTQNEER